MGVINKHYGIKFPFTIRNNDNVFLDLNNNLHEKVASEIAHVILTPKKTRLRMPDFGTDLIKYIFSPNDDLSWGDIESEIRANVTKYVPGGIINKVEVYHSEGDDNTILLSVNFGVKKGNTIENNKMVIKL
jgi:phage baseplate assembly protein W